jgi:cardiolipin synthase
LPDLHWSWFYLASEWMIRLVMLFVVPRKRSPDAAKGWLLLIFILPWPGLVLYAIIGRPWLSKVREARKQRFLEKLGEATKHLRQSRHFRHPEIEPRLSHAVTLAQNLGYFPIFGGNDAELIADYDGAIDRLIQDIDQAQKHVHLLYYIIANDSTGMKVIAALGRAVKRGVPCRVLLDSLGSRPWRRAALKELKAVGV